MTDIDPLPKPSLAESPAAGELRTAAATAGAPTPPEPQPADFIRAIVAEDQASGRWEGRVVTRFPPEPNGFLHIGHAKSICLNFGVAAENGGSCHLRFDDTNPSREEQAFVDAIRGDVRWLGFDWGPHEHYASDYFEPMADWAVDLIRAGLAYVCDLSPEAIREHRGTLTTPGRPSPYRDRSVEENLERFAAMRAGRLPEGSCVLRAKIDMASPNLNLRDPVLYRILHQAHHRSGERWCVYPMYDYAHPLSDSIEHITHSLCTLEFEDHRPLYDWFLESLGIYHPRQIEFARLKLSHTVLSKRRLARLVDEGHVAGWDDPRMPTLAGLRRRGYTPEAIRAFCEGIGVAKRDGTIPMARLEHALREDLNRRAPRALAVLRPLRVILDNWPEGEIDWLEAVNNPEDPAAGTRRLPFGRELFIEQDDFMEDPPPKYFRLAPGREVRLRFGYFIRCEGFERDAEGRVSALHCSVDRATRGGSAPDGRKVKGTLHWVSAAHALPAEVRLYDTLFTVPEPEGGPEGGDFLDHLNPAALETLPDCRLEPGLAEARPGEAYQFERLGYFCADPDSQPGRPVFNRSVGLRDTWAKLSQGVG